MKKAIFLIIFAIFEVFAFANEITVYSKTEDLYEYVENEENPNMEKMSLSEIFSKGFEQAKSELLKNKIEILNGGKFINNSISFSTQSKNVDENKFPCVNIEVENRITFNKKNFNFNVENYISKNNRVSYTFEYYVEELSDLEKINLVKKAIVGAVVSLNNCSVNNIESKITKLNQVDQFNTNTYFGNEEKKSTRASDALIVLDNKSMIVRNGIDLFLFNPFWKREINLTEQLPESALKEKNPWVPVKTSKTEFALFNSTSSSSYVFNNEGKFLIEKSLLIPDGNYFMHLYSREGKIYFRNMGGDIYNSSLLISGNADEGIREEKFIRGRIKNICSGNNGEIWIMRDDALCVYAKDGNLERIIFPSCKDKNSKDFLFTYVDEENNFYTWNYFAAQIEKFDLDGKKLWRGQLPESCKNSTFEIAKDGIIYMYSDGTVIRVSEVDAQLSDELKRICELNLKIANVNNRKENAKIYKQLSDIYFTNGGTSAAYQYLKKYLEFSPADSKAKEELLGLELVLQKEKAKIHSEKAIALYDEFGEETADEEYKSAMKILEKYKKYYPADEELQRMYSELKAIFDGEEKVVYVPALEIKSVELGVLFPALMNVYAAEPSGKLTVKNNSNSSVKNVGVKTFIRRYMDFACESDVIVEIKAGETVEIPIKTVLNSESMKVLEKANLNMQLTLSWQEDNVQKQQVITRPVTMYNKSAIVWKDTSMLSCFILPNEKSVNDFVFKSIEKSENKILSQNVSNAIAICNAVATLPINYVPDPKSPVTQLIDNEFAVDTVRLPFETLKFKGGDCDDLTALLCSLLESSGISTALITTPGHIFIALDSGMNYNNVWNNLNDGYAVLDFNGSAWIPFEVTAVGKGFMEAWKIGSHTLLNEDFEFVTVEDAMLRYQSVSVDGSDESYYFENLASKELNENNFRQIKEVFLQANSEILAKCKNANELNDIAEIYFELGDVENAIKVLSQAYELDSNNKAIVSNLAGLYNLNGDRENSTKYEKIAKSINDVKVLDNSSTTSRGDNKTSVSMKRGEALNSSGVKIKGKSGVVRRTRPVSNSVAGSSITQRSVQTAASRADEKSNFEWKK